MAKKTTKKTTKKSVRKAPGKRKHLDNVSDEQQVEDLKAALTECVEINKALDICRNYGQDWLAQMVEEHAPNVACAIINDFFIGVCGQEMLIQIDGFGRPLVNKDGLWKIRWEEVTDPRRRDECRRQYVNRMIGTPVQMHEVKKEITSLIVEMDLNERERADNAKRLVEIAERARLDRVEADEAESGRSGAPLLLPNQQGQG